MSPYPFDSNGMLILPRDTRREFWPQKKRKTGVLVAYVNCGNEWERQSTNEGTIRCHSCGKYIHVDQIETKEE